MRIFIATHTRLSFWIAMVPAFGFLIWGMEALDRSAAWWVYGLFALWAAAAFVLINRQAWRMCRPAMQILDERCDPEPLLELCRMVLKQNPDSLYFRVYESYALTLLGREEEALVSADLAQRDPRLWKTPGLLLVWSSSLPVDDLRQERVVQTLGKLGKGMPPQMRQVVERVLTQRQALALLEQAPGELEAPLREQLEQSGCLREKVGAHLALGAYYAARKDLTAEEHLNYVLENANKLRGAVVQAERFLCLLPAPDTRP